VPDDPTLSAITPAAKRPDAWVALQIVANRLLGRPDPVVIDVREPLLELEREAV
jgi:hypothetical protein